MSSLPFRSPRRAWTRSPRVAWRSLSHGRAASASCTENLSVEEQAAEVDKVKRSESGMIVEPVTLGPRDRIADALALMETYHISGVPITDNGGLLVGILTNRDLRFEGDTALPIADLMTSENLVTVPVGTTLDDAREVLHRHKIEKLPVVGYGWLSQGPHHRQRHPETHRFPARDEGRAGAPTGCRGRRSRSRCARAV